MRKKKKKAGSTLHKKKKEKIRSIRQGKKTGTRQNTDKRHSHYWVIVFPLIFLALLAGLTYFIYKNYRVTEVYVEGNTHYSDREIIHMVMSGPFCHNSLLLSLRYRNRSIDHIPFIEKTDVDILSPHTVKIKVYEKALAGYIDYLGQYIYFDREGIVVEASSKKTKGIPQVIGLGVDCVVMHEKLPVKDPKVFSEILDMTHLLSKYQLSADRMLFDKNYQVYLYFDGVNVELGDSSYLNEKVSQLSHILPELKGKSGILHMKDYTPGKKNITFDEKTS